jgi:hypothetical protein
MAHSRTRDDGGPAACAGWRASGSAPESAPAIEVSLADRALTHSIRSQIPRYFALKTSAKSLLSLKKMAQFP